MTRENSYIDQINGYYWKVASWWNKEIGGLIDSKHVARIMEQFPPFVELCQKALMSCIYEDLPRNKKVAMSDFFRSEIQYPVKEQGADICLLHAINNCIGVPLLVRTRDMIWLQQHHSG